MSSCKKGQAASLEEPSFKVRESGCLIPFLEVKEASFGSRTMGPGRRAGGGEFLNVKKLPSTQSLLTTWGKDCKSRVNKGSFRLFAFVQNKFTSAFI